MEAARAMKTILVPVQEHDLLASALETSLLLAQRFDSHIEGFALRSALAELLAVDPLAAAALPMADLEDNESALRARRHFESFMRRRGLPWTGSAAQGPSFAWLEDTPGGDSFIGSHSRVFDVTVVGRPGTTDSSPRMSTLEAALFESGRPILVAPPSPPSHLGETVVIAWNSSTETARTAALAMPLLARARRVVVLTIEGWAVAGPSGEQLTRYLQRNGIAAEPLATRSERRSHGETILATAASLGCDLLIKGAYTQSRLRQMIFGGATSHILSATTLPVFMAH